MNQKEFIQLVAERSGSSVEQTEQVYSAMVHVFSEALGKGEPVECLPTWGRFISKRRDNPGLNEHSPRQPKKPRYLIQFRSSKEFEAKLFRAGTSKQKVG